MKSLLELYNEAPAASDVGRVRETVATVQEGDRGVNFFDVQNEYHDNFIERGPGNKIVTQSTEDDATNGKYTDRALLFYADHWNARAQPEQGIHFYNQRNRPTWYSVRNEATKGVLQTYQL